MIKKFKRWLKYKILESKWYEELLDDVRDTAHDTANEAANDVISDSELASESDLSELRDEVEDRAYRSDLDDVEEKIDALIEELKEKKIIAS